MNKFHIKEIIFSDCTILSDTDCIFSSIPHSLETGWITPKIKADWLQVLYVGETGVNWDTLVTKKASTNQQSAYINDKVLLSTSQNYANSLLTVLLIWVIMVSC